MSAQETSRIARVVDDLAAAQRFLREAAETIDISRETIDELAGLPKGYAAKVLCEPPVRQLGPISMFPIAGALGFALAFIEDEQRKARISRTSKRKPGGPRGTKWRNARAIAVIAEYGRQGARAATKSMTQEQRSARASKAGKARWRKWRKARREMRRNPGLMKSLVLKPQRRTGSTNGSQSPHSPQYRSG